jgi:uncharacterized protein YndB with AHSA1/START domain
MSRNLNATIEIAATPERVWSVIGDPRKMPEFSPQTRRTVILSGEVGTNALMLNVNRHSWKVWPTTARIVRYEPNRALAFRMSQNHSVWSLELSPSADGTALTQRRDVSAGVPGSIRKLLGLMFRSEENFESILVEGMNSTLAKIKAAAER